MSDAIEFSLGGSNKNFVAVLNDTERKAKESATRTNKELDKVGSDGLKGKKKIASDLDSIAGKFAEVKSVSSALEGVLSKLGTGAKVGGIVALGGLIAKGFADAATQALELEKTLEKIRHKNSGGVGNVSMGELEANLATTRAERTKLIDPTKNQTKPGLLRAGADIWDGTKTALGDLATTGVLNSDYTEKKHEEMRQEELRALDRIGEKQREITELERVRITRSTEEADILKLQAEYAEKIDTARDKGRGSVEAFTALTEERDFKIAEVQRRARQVRLEQSRAGNDTYLRGRDSGKVSSVDAAAGNLSYAKEAAGLASTKEEKDIAEQNVKSAEVALKIAEKEEAERKAILETESRISSIRGGGAKAQKQALEEQLRLAEKLSALATGTVEKESRLLEVAKSRKALDEFELSRRVTEIQDNSEIAQARIGNLATKKGIKGSAIDEQRLSLNANVQKAEAAKLAASQALDLDKESPQLQKNFAMAEEAVSAAVNERSKWERDIARSKKDQLDSIDAQLEATRLTLNLRGIEADLVTKRAATELAATQAVRAGNDELAKRIRQLGELQTKQDKFNRALNPNTGRLESEGERVKGVRNRRRQRIVSARDRGRFDRSGGLVNVRRDTSGAIISGIDPDSGERVSPPSGSGGATNSLGDASKGGTDFADALTFRGAAAMRNGTSMNPLVKSVATTEMDARQDAAESLAASRASMDKVVRAKEDAINNGTAGPDVALGRVVQIMEKWDR